MGFQRCRYKLERARLVSKQRAPRLDLHFSGVELKGVRFLPDLHAGEREEVSDSNAGARRSSERFLEMRLGRSSLYALELKEPAEGQHWIAKDSR